MSPAAEDLIGENKNSCCRAVDATNCASLREALGEAEDELIITTEGMLMYFTQPETASMRFTGASRPVREIFETTGFSQMLDIL